MLKACGNPDHFQVPRGEALPKTTDGRQHFSCKANGATCQCMCKQHNQESVHSGPGNQYSSFSFWHPKPPLGLEGIGIDCGTPPAVFHVWFYVALQIFFSVY
jgi:hypothetical protein